MLRYDGREGTFIDAFIPRESGLVSPGGLDFGPDGDLFVVSGASEAGGDVLRFDGTTGAAKGTFIPAGRGGLDTPTLIGCFRPVR